MSGSASRLCNISAGLYHHRNLSLNQELCLRSCSWHFILYIQYRACGLLTSLFSWFCHVPFLSCVLSCKIRAISHSQMRKNFQWQITTITLWFSVRPDGWWLDRDVPAITYPVNMTGDSLVVQSFIEDLHYLQVFNNVHHSRSRR